MIQKGSDPFCMCNWGLTPIVSFSEGEGERGAVAQVTLGGEHQRG